MLQSSILQFCFRLGENQGWINLKTATQDFRNFCWSLFLSCLIKKASCKGILVLFLVLRPLLILYFVNRTYIIKKECNGTGFKKPHTKIDTHTLHNLGPYCEGCGILIKLMTLITNSMTIISVNISGIKIFDKFLWGFDALVTRFGLFVLRAIESWKMNHAVAFVSRRPWG